MSTGVYFATQIIFIIFGSADTQPWNTYWETDKESKEDKKGIENQAVTEEWLIAIISN